MSTKSPLTNPRMANLPAQGVATRFAVLGLLAAALSGCTVGPDFQRPAAPPVDRYTATPTTATTATTATQHGVAQQLVKGLPIEAQWWRTLGSPALDRLIGIRGCAEHDWPADIICVCQRFAQQARGIRLGVDQGLEIKTGRVPQPGMRRPCVAVDATVFAAAVRVE